MQRPPCFDPPLIIAAGTVRGSNRDSKSLWDREGYNRNAAPVDVIKDVDNVITGMLQSPKLDIRSFWFSATA
jgi:hypothetical protein